jgi:hypothetical protein
LGYDYLPSRPLLPTTGFARGQSHRLRLRPGPYPTAQGIDLRTRNPGYRARSPADTGIRVEAAGFPVVLWVHDEVVCEVEESRDGDVEHFRTVMSEVPDWAAGLPIAMEAWSDCCNR